MGAAVESWEDIDVPVGEGRKKGTKYGGTNEGFLGGQPGGFRTALAYKPSDSAPIVIHKPLSYNDEVDVSLPMKMQFLNMTDTHRLYDDDEPVVNSQSQYKKLKKRLAK